MIIIERPAGYSSVAPSTVSFIHSYIIHLNTKHSVNYYTSCAII